MSKSFYSHLRKLRIGRGLTLEGVASACGVSAQFIHRVEQGQTPFPAEHLKALASCLQVDPEELVVEYAVPMLDRIYERAGLSKPTYRIVPI